MSLETKFIGLKELRKNFSKIFKELSERRARFIIMKHNQPVAVLAPVDQGDPIFKKNFYGKSRR